MFLWWLPWIMNLPLCIAVSFFFGYLLWLIEWSSDGCLILIHLITETPEIPGQYNLTQVSCWEWDNTHPCILSWCHGLVTGETEVMTRPIPARKFRLWRRRIQLEATWQSEGRLAVCSAPFPPSFCQVPSEAPFGTAEGFTSGFTWSPPKRLFQDRLHTWSRFWSRRRLTQARWSHEIVASRGLHINLTSEAVLPNIF